MKRDGDLKKQSKETKKGKGEKGTGKHEGKDEEAEEEEAESLCEHVHIVPATCEQPFALFIKSSSGNPMWSLSFPINSKSNMPYSGGRAMISFPRAMLKRSIS